jgi:hypothetical protein
LLYYDEVCYTSAGDRLTQLASLSSTPEQEVVLCMTRHLLCPAVFLTKRVVKKHSLRRLCRAAKVQA